MKRGILARLGEPDRLAGLIFILFGAGFAIGAGEYDIGSAAQMGPGYFPRLLGGLLAVLGAVIFAGARPGSGESSQGRVPWRAMLAILCGVAVFGLLLKTLGLFIASILLVVLSALARRRPEWKEILVLAVLLAAATCAVFVWGLQLPLPVWPAWS